MVQAVLLDDELVNAAKVVSDTYFRSISEQIEHWVKIGRIAEKNPDLNYNQIKDILISASEIKQS